MLDQASGEWKFYVITNISREEMSIDVHLEQDQQFTSERIELVDEARFRPGVAAAVRQRIMKTLVCFLCKGLQSQLCFFASRTKTPKNQHWVNGQKFSPTYLA